MALFGTGFVARLRSAAPVAPKAHSVESYWTGHNVTAHYGFKDVADSLDYLHWRDAQYYGYADLMPTAGFDGLSILDFGCGPGHDLVGFGVFSKPSRLTGIDVSPTSLAQAQSRLGLHGISADLHRVDVQQQSLPIPDGSIDLVHCSGVLHHMADPGRALREFRRVLKPGGTAQIMVYNRQSLFYHLYVPYVLQIEEGKLSGLSRDDAFRGSTDGPDCPISRAYRQEEFQGLADPFGFELVSYGVAVSASEMIQLPKRHMAMLDRRLPRESREFLSGLRFDDRGLPLANGQHAGIDGCYRFRAG
jgi:ubiquinone/menaquinone biosynthesis C-methylase UbiE